MDPADADAQIRPETRVKTYGAILLCAGYGTRMGALTATTPKPLLEVAGRPVLDYLLDQLAEISGLTTVDVVTNHHYADAFGAWAEARAADWRRHRPERRFELRIHDDGTVDNATRLGAIGDLGFVLERVGLADGALVSAGDNILRFSLEPFWRRFLAADADNEGPATSCVMAQHEPSLERLRRTGVLEIDAGGRVLTLVEKPEDPPSTWACPSVYALDRRALAEVGPYLAADLPADEIGRFLGHLVDRRRDRRDEDVVAHEIRGSRLHVGNPEELEHANRILDREPVLLD